MQGNVLRHVVIKKSSSKAKIYVIFLDEGIVVISSPNLYLQVEFDADGKAIGVTSEGETAKCKKVVCDPSYLTEKVASET